MRHNNMALNAAAVTVVPYMSSHLVQVWMEVRGMRYSIMTPAIPLAYMYYRLLQLARSLWMLGWTSRFQATTLPFFGVFIFLSLFWAYDTGVVLVFLPWTYNWHLQQPIAEKKSPAR